METKNTEDMSLNELVSYITLTFHLPLRQILNKLEGPVVFLEKNYSEQYSELSILSELFNQFKNEISKHISKEDSEVFPTIINYERIYNNGIDQPGMDLDTIEKLVTDVKMKNDHSDFNSYLDSIIDLLEKTEINGKQVEEFEEVKQDFLNIHKENIKHAYIENTELYSKGMKLQNKLKEKFLNMS